MGETRFEDFVGIISALNKEIQRIKDAEARRLGFEPVIHPGKGGIATIADLQQKLFHRKQ